MTTNTTPASRFRVERAGPFRIHHDTERGWLVLCSTMGAENFGWLHPDGFFIDYIGETDYELLQLWKVVCKQIYYPTEAEARYRLLLYQNPREALAAFSRGTGWEYVGTCGYCDGVKLQTPCPTCHGTGGPPSAETLSIAADWMDERWMPEAEWVRSVAEGVKE